MKRILRTAALSIALYALLFSLVLDRPLSLGLLHLEIQQKTARLATLPSPKLVILAGSNAPYSHSCAIIGPMLQMPCENAGIAVGIGLDDLFARDAPYLHKGDIIYLPMEMDQYTITRAANRAAPDAGFLLRHDRFLLPLLPADRIAGAIFCCNLADLLESLAEMPLAGTSLIRPASILSQQYNLYGDRINTTLATADKQLLNMQTPNTPSQAAIESGYGGKLIANFVKSESADGLIIIGGLPTQFNNILLPPATLETIAAIYTKNGGRFIALPNHSQYPRADFYDSKDHLAQPCQAAHSIAIAKLLAITFNKPLHPAPATAQSIASTCPG